jgi:hypothetical protein
MSLAGGFEMRGLTLFLATTLTFGYGFAAQAAMRADRAETFRRLASVTISAPTVDATRVYNGGTLAPVTVEADAQPKCELT